MILLFPNKNLTTEWWCNRHRCACKEKNKNEERKDQRN